MDLNMVGHSGRLPMTGDDTRKCLVDRVTRTGVGVEDGHWKATLAALAAANPAMKYEVPDEPPQYCDDICMRCM